MTLVAPRVAQKFPRVSSVGWSRCRSARAVRLLLQGMLVPVVRWLCRPLSVAGRGSLPSRGVVYVANHSSHADTAAILAAMPARVRRRVAPAAAEDYFYSGRVRGAAVSLAIGAFPFPRRGREGIARARVLLDAGWSVLLFPEGTRSRDGSPSEFKCGAGILAAKGYTVVPVGVAGTRDVLPPHSAIPRQNPVAVAFGEPATFSSSSTPKDIAITLRCRVRSLVARAEGARRPSRRTWYERIHAFAERPAAVALAFGWGVAEAIAWPIIPEVAIALLAAAAPKRTAKFVLAALVGSVTGGAIAYALGAAFGMPPLPLVTPRMRVAAMNWMSAEGAHGLWHNLYFGVPYKTFAWQAHARGVGESSLAVATIAVRGLRFLAVGAAFGLVALPWRRWAHTFYGAFSAVFLVAFAIGLVGTVAKWS